MKYINCQNILVLYILVLIYSGLCDLVVGCQRWHSCSRRSGSNNGKQKGGQGQTRKVGCSGLCCAGCWVCKEKAQHATEARLTGQRLCKCKHAVLVAGGVVTAFDHAVWELGPACGEDGRSCGCC